MSDLGTVSILVDVRGQPVVRELAQDLNRVAAAEAKVSAATQKVMADFRRTRDIMAMLKKTTDDTSASFQRFSAKDLQQATQRMQGFESSLANTRRGMGQMGMATQQVGYQVGDFLVQIQSGTSPLVAFGQQATQLVGILPAFSGVLGMSVSSLIGLSAGLGIAIPLVTAIGAVFMRTSESSDAAAKSVEEQKEAYDSLVESIRQLRLEQQMAVSGMGSSQQAVANELNQLQLERNVLLVEQEELGRKNNETAYSNVSLAEQELALRIQTNAKAIEDRERLLGIYEQEAQKLRDIEGSLQFSANYITLVAERALDAAEATDKIDFSKAISGAARLADELGISVSHASRIMALTGGRRGTILDPRDPNYDPIAAGMVGLREDYGKVSPFDPSRQPKVRESGGAARIKKETEAVKELTEAEKQRLNILKSVESSLESGFMSMVDGTKSVKSAFRSMAADIVKELYRVLVVQRLVGAISGGIGMFSGRSTGSLGLPFGLATGGSMMPGKSYLVGENGPELVIPRHSGTVVNANQTANAAGGSGGVTVQNNISVTGSDAAMVRAEVAKMIPQITNATKAAVIDARLRGGQMKAAFT